MAENKGKYDDIIGLPHPDPKNRPRMKRSDRAAQFMPFAALTGYEAAVEEAGRRTSERVSLDESEKEAVDAALRALKRDLLLRPEAEVHYFVPDLRKEGGEYRTLTGRVVRVDAEAGILVFESGEEVPFGDIVRLTPAGN